LSPTIFLADDEVQKEYVRRMIEGEEIMRNIIKDTIVLNKL